MTSGNLYICTWLFAESEREESTYFQVPGRSSSAAFQNAYWRCVALFFATSYRHQPKVKHLLFTNVTTIPTIAEVHLDGFLEKLEVEIVRLPLTFATPPGFYHAYRNQFYVFDIARYLSSRLGSEDSAILLDSDCAWIAGVGPMQEALARDGVLTYVENYPVDWSNNGMTREEMRIVASYLLDEEVHYPLIYCGGEILAATKSQLKRIVAEIELVWEQLIARHSRGEATFNEEGQTLSYIYYKLRYPLGNGDPFIRRIATGSFGAFNTALPHDNGLVVWHVPLEKRLGIRRLFPEIMDEGSRFWSLPLGRGLREYLGAYLGVYRNPLAKRVRDLGRRVRDKVEHR